MKLTLSGVVSVLLLCAAVFAAESDALKLGSGVSPHGKIDAIYQVFSDGYKNLDPSFVTKVYTDDALYLAPDQDIQKGAKPIVDGFTGWFQMVKQQQEQLRIKFEIVERKVAQDLGFDVGIFTLSRMKNGTTLSSDRGKFIVVTQEMPDGSWKFRVDGYSTLKPEK